MPAQLRRIERGLKSGLKDQSGLWTAGRVQELTEDRTGVRYHEDHVWHILRKPGWTCRHLTGWALESDEEAIQHWKKVNWPRIKKRVLREAHHRLYRREQIEPTTASGYGPGPRAGRPRCYSTASTEGAFRPPPTSADGASTSGSAPAPCTPPRSSISWAICCVLPGRTISGVPIAEKDCFRMYYGTELTGVAVLHWSAGRTDWHT
jgi:hypothetical protein